MGAGPLPPLRVRNSGGAPNAMPVFDMVFSGATLTRVGATGIQVLVDSGGGGGGAPTGSQYVVLAPDATLTAERILAAGTGMLLTNLGAGDSLLVSLVTPVSVPSGGTGAATFTAFGVLYGSGATAVQALPTMASGQLVVGSGTNMRPHVLAAGAAGQAFLTSAGAIGGVTWVNTASIVRSTTVRIPMALATVQPTTGNAYWVGRTSSTVDVSYVGYVDGGVGLATYWAVVPVNLAPTPAWNLLFYHAPESGSGGNVVLSVSAATVAVGGSIPGATLTGLMGAVALTTRVASILEVGTGTGTNFDGTLAITSGDYLMCQVWRLGGSASDTVAAQWNLYSVVLRADVLT